MLRDVGAKISRFASCTHTAFLRFKSLADFANVKGDDDVVRLRCAESRRGRGGIPSRVTRRERRTDLGFIHHTLHLPIRRNNFAPGPGYYHKIVVVISQSQEDQAAENFGGRPETLGKVDLSDSSKKLLPSKRDRSGWTASGGS